MLPLLMKQLPPMVPEAAASTHKHQTSGAAAPTSTNLDDKNCADICIWLSKATPPRRKRRSRRRRPLRAIRARDFSRGAHPPRGGKRLHDHASNEENGTEVPPLPAPTEVGQGFRLELIHKPENGEVARPDLGTGAPRWPEHAACRKRPYRSPPICISGHVLRSTSRYVGRNTTTGHGSAQQPPDPRTTAPCQPEPATSSPGRRPGVLHSIRRLHETTAHAGEQQQQPWSPAPAGRTGEARSGRVRPNPALPTRLLRTTAATALPETREAAAPAPVDLHCASRRQHLDREPPAVAPTERELSNGEGPAAATTTRALPGGGHQRRRGGRSKWRELLAAGG